MVPSVRGLEGAMLHSERKIEKDWQCAVRKNKEKNQKRKTKGEPPFLFFSLPLTALSSILLFCVLSLLTVGRGERKQKRRTEENKGDGKKK